ncbi:hypothetical protein DPW03_03075 [Aggregatibacter aphrophilus]|jgi:hypothetical protein|nr:hypothetical protein DPW02_01850 [Aggregatibacter aphrophilus]RDE99104.1 hypothetical protein DPW03_03075 [Aggregatibacter aphrophilus]DAS97678.1 MAG TPA: hypothetical protein [Caudoviricetes sp.]DAX58263.1 MAG TPA: hypothetical protein [Caudoviricetes sp.]
MDLNQKMDYSKLSAVELNAISTSYQNMGKRKDESFNSAFPYTTEAIQALAEQFNDYPAEHIDGLKIIHDELLAINKHLLAMAPKPPSPDPEEVAAELFNDELIDSLLKHCVVNSLVSAFSYFQKTVAMRIHIIESGTVEGVNHGTLN